MALGSQDGRSSSEIQVFGQEQLVRVLLVDDDDAVRAALTRLLRRRGATVEEFSSGFRALARLSETTFDVAILDLSMPDIDGEELACALLERVPTMRVLFISGESDCERGNRIRDMGARVFGKPWDTEDVLSAVYGT
jgi:FixJ family two-component response regulator